MGIKRIGKHLIEHHWRARRMFPPARAGGDRAGDQGLRGHPCRPGPLRGLKARSMVRRCFAINRRGVWVLDIFARLRIWDTAAHNNGIPI